MYQLQNECAEENLKGHGFVNIRTVILSTVFARTNFFCYMTKILPFVIKV